MATNDTHRHEEAPIDSSALHLMCARRGLVEHATAIERLNIIRRLQRRYVECRLPRYSESRVEQSFNEQLFTRVLGYRTLFSHDALPYHLRPKNYASGNGRYDDFSLGFFWGDERDRVVATAEFKDPGTDLDAPQKDRREKISPVSQAFRAAAGFPSCAWVIVSNFRELRLYRATHVGRPLATFDLHETRTSKQLAALCAHFDRRALLGIGGNSDMVIALDPNHPSAPLPPAENAFRLICTFTSAVTDLELPLFVIYDAVRDAAIEVLKVKQGDWERSPNVPTRLEDGWCSVDSGSIRLAMSAEGQVRCTIRHVRKSGPAQLNPDAGFWTIAHQIHTFFGVVDRLFASVQRKVTGHVAFELREIKNWRLYFNSSKLIRENDDTNAGVAERDEILSGDLSWAVGADASGVAADGMSELALQFRSDDGCRLRFEHGGLVEHFRAEAAAKLNQPLQLPLGEGGRRRGFGAPRRCPPRRSAGVGTRSSPQAIASARPVTNAPRPLRRVQFSGQLREFTPLRQVEKGHGQAQKTSCQTPSTPAVPP